VRAPLALPALMDALGSGGEDMRRHGTCAPTAMARSAACAMTIGDGRTDDEGASGIGVKDGRAARPTMRHNVTAEERVVGKGTRTNERSRCYVGHQADKDKRVGIRCFCF
jgi:hypothetical protein